jgi:hypothetical protein
MLRRLASAVGHCKRPVFPVRKLAGLQTSGESPGITIRQDAKTGPCCQLRSGALSNQAFNTGTARGKPGRGRRSGGVINYFLMHCNTPPCPVCPCAGDGAPPVLRPRPGLPGNLTPKHVNPVLTGLRAPTYKGASRGSPAAYGRDPVSLRKFRCDDHPSTWSKGHGRGSFRFEFLRRRSLTLWFEKGKRGRRCARRSTLDGRKAFRGDCHKRHWPIYASNMPKAWVLVCASGFRPRAQA